MATQEELAKAWAKGQPGLGLYLGCRAVRRVSKGTDQTGRFDAGKGELTIVTVENVVDGMARVSEEGGTSMGAPIDTLVLFKLATTTDGVKLQHSKDQGNSIKGRILTNGHIGGDRADRRTEEETDCSRPDNWSDLFSSRSKEAFILPTSSSSDLQDEDQEEEESKNGIDWKPGVGTSSGNNWYDCMKYVGPIPAAEALTVQSNQSPCPRSDTNLKASVREDLGQPLDVAEFIQSPLFQAGRPSNHIRRAGCRSRRNRREVQEPRRRMDSPTMEEMDSSTKEERSLDVSHLLEQLKVAREAEGGEVEGVQNEVGGAFIGLEGNPAKVEEVYNMEPTEHNARDGSPNVMNTNSDVGVFNVENANPRKAIGDASEIEGSVEVEAICDGAEGEFKGQVSEDELDGNNEAPASGIEDANQERELLESSECLMTDQSTFLPTSLPTAASVSRWVEGDQLHKVRKSWLWW